MIRTVFADVLLALGVGVSLLSAAGALAMNDVYDRLHLIGPACTLGPLLLGAALVVQEGGHLDGWKGLFALGLFAAASPVITQAIALASRTRTFGGFEILPEEEKE